MRTIFVGATVLVVGATASTAWAVNGPDTTGNNIALQGSDTLEEVTKGTVESGFMTKDLALLVGAEQAWLTTEGFLDKVAENLNSALAA